MDIRKVKKLIELIEKSDVAEIEIHEGEESVRISRGSAFAATPQIDVIPSTPTVSATGSESIKSHLQSEEDKISDYTDQGHVISSPMVGIFYNSPSPDAPPFVNKGQVIKLGDTLCIIEAMKIMNHIDSDVNGKLLRVLVENGDAVEYGQPLFIIDLP